MPKTQSGEAARAEREYTREKREPFEYVAYWTFDKKPGRIDQESGSINDLEAVLTCALCAFNLHREGQLTERVVKFPKHRTRKCERCGGSLKRKVLDPTFSVRDHLREKAEPGVLSG